MFNFRDRLIRPVRNLSADNLLLRNYLGGNAFVEREVTLQGLFLGTGRPW